MAFTPPEIDWWSVPRMWPGETVAILAGGPCLTQEQVNYLEGKCRVIAINRAGIPKPRGHPGRWCYAPFADMLFAADVGSPEKPGAFWALHQEAALQQKGIKVAVRAIMPNRVLWRRMQLLAGQGVKLLRHTSPDITPMGRHEGASDDPGIVCGNNSLAMVLSVIAHTGATTVLLLGASMHGGHWHNGYLNTGMPDLANEIVPKFATLVRPLARAGILVLNCSPGSALHYFGDPVSVFDVL